MFVRTENLLLRPSWTDDLDEFVALIAEEYAAGNIATTGLPESTALAREIIARPREQRLPHFFINLRSDDGLKLIGSIALNETVNGTELCYWISARHWRQGYASEAARAVLEHAWMLGHDRITAIHFDGNEATRRVLARADFAPSGEYQTLFNAREGRDDRAHLYVASRPADVEATGYRMNEEPAAAIA